LRSVALARYHEKSLVAEYQSICLNLAEKLSSDYDDDSDKEGDDQDDDDDDDDVDSNGSQDLPEQLSQLAVEEQELEDLENPDDQEPDKIKIHE